MIAYSGERDGHFLLDLGIFIISLPSINISAGIRWDQIKN